MISFQSDYNNGMLPEILEALGRTNDDKTPGYGYDHYTESAKQKIREAVDNEEADVFFLVGGTQTNTTVIDSVLLGCEGVVCVETGHIEVHESGAVEAFGHKVITLPSVDSKLTDSWLTRRIRTWCNQEWCISQCLLSLEWYTQGLSLRICTPHAGNMICVCLSMEHDWAMD